MLKSTHKPVSALPSLPAGWTEHKAPTGRQCAIPQGLQIFCTYFLCSLCADICRAGHSYYFNAATNISTYTRPSGVQHISPQPGPTSDFSNIISQGTQLGYQNGALRRPGDPHYHLFAHSHSASGRGDFRGGHSGQRRPPPDDRPKSKHIIPLCSPWFLVKTRLGRRFVYNPEKGESFWKFPPDVMKGVIEYDRLERERKERRERGEENGSDDDGFEAAEELNTAPIGALEGPSLATRETSGVPPQDESDEYEEVEVTDDEDDENPTKRQKTEIEDPEQPVEFNEDDIAYQLAAMGQDYGLDPGEYGDGEDEELEEGAGGLPLTEEDTSALFKDMLDDHHISPYTTWEKIIESNVIVEDDRYTVLPNMKSRKEIWGEWSMDRIQRLREKRERQEKQNPLIPFLAFLQNNATPKLYWPEFRRKFKKESEMRDAKLSDKEREKWYRDYINRTLYVLQTSSLKYFYS